MADKITFLNKINDSVQVGDELYYSTLSGGVASAETEVGVITGIGEKYVEVGDGEAPGFVADTLFFMFRKPAHNGHTNTSSLKGYYAEVEFTNGSTSKQELFTVGSEVTESSK
tara:strand:+ start:104 stop:442 length:339 start_codon:yes stop_codon:yes gene_type:complete